MLHLGPGSLILPFRNCASKITSRTERLPALLHLVNQHSPIQRNPPLVPTCSDNLLNRNPRTPCLVHSVMPVQVLQLREVPLAGWVKLRRNRRGDLVLSTRLSSRPSSLQQVALGPSTKLSHLRMLACSAAAVHLHPKINRWAGLVRLIISVLSSTYNITGGTGSFGATPNTGSTGLFGQTNTAQQPPAPTSLFGQNQPAGSAFGGGAFGVWWYTFECVLELNSFRAGANTAGQKPPLFGQTQQQPATGSGFGLFGSQQQQAPQGQAQQGTTGLFGNQPGFSQANTTQTGQPQQGGCTLLFTIYCLNSTNRRCSI